MEENKKSAYELATDVLEQFRKRMDAVIEEKRKEVLGLQLKNVTILYKQALYDINRGLNLEKWEKDIDAAIEEVNLSKKNYTEPTPGLDALKNEFFFLKYLISEVA